MRKNKEVMVHVDPDPTQDGEWVGELRREERGRVAA